MANRHFGKLADVWKHLPLAEILSVERPTHYWESHAGSALYEMVNDPERAYGAQHFLDVSAQYPHLSRSQYRKQLMGLTLGNGRIQRYPGSPMIAMTVLGSRSSYLFCDLDDESVSDLHGAADGLALGSCVEVAQSDGMATLHDAMGADDTHVGTLAHIDPYDPHAKGPGGTSALELATELFVSGVRVVYWYGYNHPGERAWALDEMRNKSDACSLWCGDVLVKSDTDSGVDGDLGTATTPGTGCGIVCANLDPESLRACELLGTELVLAYDRAQLPGGESGHLDFVIERA